MNERPARLGGLRERIRRVWHFWWGPSARELSVAHAALRGRAYYELYDDRYRQLQDLRIRDRDFLGVVRARKLVYDDWERLRREGLLPGPGATVIDLGCGEGDNTLYFAQAGYRVTGVDVSTAAIAVASTAAQGCPGRVLNVDFRVGDVLSLGAFGSGVFDVATDIGCLHMLVRTRHRQLYLREAHRVLRPGGVAFLFNHVARRDVRVTDENAHIWRFITFRERRWIPALGAWLSTRGCGFRDASVRQYHAELQAAGFHVRWARPHVREGYVTLLAEVPNPCPCTYHGR